MIPTIGIGATAFVYQHTTPGVVVKKPSRLTRAVERRFITEAKILPVLGDHKHIVQ